MRSQAVAKPGLFVVPLRQAALCCAALGGESNQKYHPITRAPVPALLRPACELIL